jgi:four helix bundle protein
LKQSYKDLEIYKEAFDLFIQIHNASMNLPKFEIYELGSQIRRSSDSTVTNIVEGFGRRAYKNEFIRFLIFSHSSCLETGCHLEKILQLYPQMSDSIKIMQDKYDILGKRIFKFISYVNKHWKT